MQNLSAEILKRNYTNLSINMSQKNNLIYNENNKIKTLNKNEESRLNDSQGSKTTKSSSFTDSISLDTEIGDISAFKSLSPFILNLIYKQIIREDKTQKKHLVNFENQRNISEIQYAVLIDWIIHVHTYLALTDECLFLSVKLIIEFLARVDYFDQENFQLLGVACMLVSSKFIERSHIAIDELCSLCVKSYTKKQIIAFEHTLLLTLDFEIEQDNIINFFDLLALMFNFTLKEYYQGKFMLELTLLEINMLIYRKTIIAFSVAYLVMKMNIDRHPHYKKCFFYLKDRETTEKLLKECGREILQLFDNIQSSQYTSSIQKYANINFKQLMNKYE